MTKLVSHLSQHRWFYIALTLGISAAFAVNDVDPALTIPVGGDTFYAAYLIFIGRIARHLTAARLRTRAAVDDEGMVIIATITVGAMCVSLVSIFTLLNSHPTPDFMHLVLALGAAPLSWVVLHINAAFHYAHYYYGDPDGVGGEPQRGGLKFPGGRPPGIWDFIYFAFVIGMTAQTADVDIESTWIRRRAIGHGIIAFVFNTVLIAMAVNVVVALLRAH